MMRFRRALPGFGGLLMLLAMLSLAACSSPLAATKPTPTPDAATILANSQKVKYTDIEFTMTITGTSSGTSVSGNGSGTVTTTPNRADITLDLTASGTELSFETIVDSVTSTTYVKFTGTSIPGIPVGKWIKESGSSSSVSPIDPSIFSNVGKLSNPTLVGSETVDGIAVWHLKGQETSGADTANADVYVRKDNNQIYQAVIHTTGTSTTDVTIKFTGVNTGKTVDLPPADQVISQP